MFPNFCLYIVFDQSLKIWAESRVFFYLFLGEFDKTQIPFGIF